MGQSHSADKHVQVLSAIDPQVAKLRDDLLKLVDKHHHHSGEWTETPLRKCVRCQPALAAWHINVEAVHAKVLASSESHQEHCALRGGLPPNHDGKHHYEISQHANMILAEIKGIIEGEMTHELLPAAQKHVRDIEVEHHDRHHQDREKHVEPSHSPTQTRKPSHLTGLEGPQSPYGSVPSTPISPGSRADRPHKSAAGTRIVASIDPDLPLSQRAIQPQSRSSHAMPQDGPPPLDVPNADQYAQPSMHNRPPSQLPNGASQLGQQPQNLMQQSQHTGQPSTHSRAPSEINPFAQQPTSHRPKPSMVDQLHASTAVDAHELSKRLSQVPPNEMPARHHQQGPSMADAQARQAMPKDVIDADKLSDRLSRVSTAGHHNRAGSILDKVAESSGDQRSTRTAMGSASYMHDKMATDEGRLLPDYIGHNVEGTTLVGHGATAQSNAAQIAASLGTDTYAHAENRFPHAAENATHHSELPARSAHPQQVYQRLPSQPVATYKPPPFPPPVDRARPKDTQMLTRQAIHQAPPGRENDGRTWIRAPALSSRATQERVSRPSESQPRAKHAGSARHSNVSSGLQAELYGDTIDKHESKKNETEEEEEEEDDDDDDDEDDDEDDEDYEEEDKEIISNAKAKLANVLCGMIKNNANKNVLKEDTSRFENVTEAAAAMIELENAARKDAAARTAQRTTFVESSPAEDEALLKDLLRDQQKQRQQTRPAIQEIQFRTLHDLHSLPKHASTQTQSHRTHTHQPDAGSPGFIGEIGGSGLYSIGLQVVQELQIDTPFGAPSSPVTLAKLPSGQPVAFIARHGLKHTISPSEVPVKANIAALKHLGVQAIVAFSAVGSLRKEIKPRDVVIPNQIIDRTKGIRDSTFFGNGIVAHAMFGDPFDNQLIDIISPIVEATIKKHQLAGVDLHTNKTVVCMEGPAFSTRAESRMYRQLGGDIINMSVLPEAKLAREAELSYALICTSTDYDAWKEDDPVTVAEVVKTLHDNAKASDLIAQAILEQLHDIVATGQKLTNAKGSMQYSIISKKEGWPAETKKRLAYILPYFE